MPSRRLPQIIRVPIFLLILSRSEGSLNQHIKLKHPEFYAQMSANNQNIAGLSKRESTLNDGKSMNSESYDRSISDESDEEESYSGSRHHQKEGIKYEDNK